MRGPGTEWVLLQSTPGPLELGLLAFAFCL